MTKIAVILAGCGFLDGSEIHESVLGLLALSQGGAAFHCFAPEGDQKKVVDHLTGGEKEEERRSILEESARLARGKVSPLRELDPASYSGLFIPGGFGAAQNLCSYAWDPENYTVDSELEEVIRAFHRAQKPIGATCIAPVILAKVFQGKERVKLTLGREESFYLQLKEMGMDPVKAGVEECVMDEVQRIYTTPCYMEPEDLKGMFEGVTALVRCLCR